MPVCQHFLTTGMRHSPFMDEALPSIRTSVRGQLVETLITLEPHGIFGSNFANIYFLTLPIHWYKNGDEVLPTNRPEGHGQLVKTLIILESHGIF